MKRVIRTMWLAGASLGFVSAASARDGHGSRGVPLLPRYQQECASCHVAYPPGLLPSSSWKRLIEGLPKHFGTDASVDAATARELSTWLQAHSADTRRRDATTPPSEDRITRSSWFVHEHDEVAPATWKLPAVKSPSNCAACHRGADQGVFNEHDVRIPR
jgi:mono/diheme cytochrome c family protein